MSYKLAQHPAHEKLWNAMGATSINGMQQVIDTQTQIVAGVIETKYYELHGQSLSDFMPFDIGMGQDSLNIFQFTSEYKGGDFEEGNISISTGLQANATTTIEVGGFNIPNQFWRKDYTVSQELVSVAAKNMVAFSVIEENEKSRKKNWDLGIQKITFLGNKSGTMFGLYNLPNVTVNTSLLPKKVTAMSAAEIKTFASNVVATFSANSGDTALPNRWCMPTNEFLGLGVPVDPTYPLKTLRMVLEEAFVDAGCVGFKIVHTKYGNTANSTGTRGRHVFYNAQPDTIKFLMPKDYTPHALYPQNGVDLISVASGQYAGVVNYRPAEVLYADVQA